MYKRQATTDGQQMTFALDSLDIVPPIEQAVLPTLTEEMIAHNKKRLATEDSIRLSLIHI